jgi:hypothetical protein
VLKPLRTLTVPRCEIRLENQAAGLLALTMLLKLQLIFSREYRPELCPCERRVANVAKDAADASLGPSPRKHGIPQLRRLPANRLCWSLASGRNQPPESRLRSGERPDSDAVNTKVSDAAMPHSRHRQVRGCFPRAVVESRRCGHNPAHSFPCHTSNSGSRRKREGP